MTTFFYNSGNILKHPAGPRKLKGGRKEARGEKNRTKFKSTSRGYRKQHHQQRDII